MYIRDDIPNQFHVEGYVPFADADGYSSRYHAVRAMAQYDSAELRDAALATFPKWVKVKATTLHRGAGVRVPLLSFGVTLTPDATTGQLNETGAKRIRRFLEIADHVWSSSSKNSAATEADFMATIPEAVAR